MHIPDDRLNDTARAVIAFLLRRKAGHGYAWTSRRRITAALTTVDPDDLRSALEQLGELGHIVSEDRPSASSPVFVPFYRLHPSAYH